MYVHDAIPSGAHISARFRGEISLCEGHPAAESSPYRRPQRRSPDSAGPARHGEYVRNSTGLTDGFDAPTEAPTEWNTGVDGVEGRDYEISVSGYRNYVHEMERMLDEQADSVRSLPRRRRASGSDSGGARARQRSLRSYASKDDVRRPDVVQSRTAGEGPSRSISLWRERVAQSSTEDERIDALHHEAPARQVAASKAPASKTTGRSSGSGSKSKCMSKGSSGDYERTEVPSCHSYTMSRSQNHHSTSSPTNNLTATDPSRNRSTPHLSWASPLLASDGGAAPALRLRAPARKQRPAPQSCPHRRRRRRPRTRRYESYASHRENR